MNVNLEISIPMWGRLYRKSAIDKWNIRFLDGFHTDNIPFTSLIYPCILPTTSWLAIEEIK